MASEKKNIFEPVKADVSIPGKENETLQFWESEKIFEESLRQTVGKKFFSFYDGPPFATGLPHYGHLLAGTLKDIVPRYWTMRGYHVPRVFGWDCHGLPVEFEIDKSLKIDSRKQVLAMGVDKYNAACRSIVTRYSGEWKRTVKRIGRWVDMENAYFTMNPQFMGSVWWVFQQLWQKNLVYEGYKVVPYSVGCSTPLSNFEANLNYKDVQDPALTVQFKMNGVGEYNEKFVAKITGSNSSDIYFLAWTTTPWTLPSNLALAVGADFDYAFVKNPETGKTYVLAKALVAGYKKELGLKEEWIAKNGDLNIPDMKIVKGRELVGMTYEPLFPYFGDKAKEGSFKVVTSDHVTTDSGTGIVHIAPAFGEEDFYAGQKNGIGIVNPVDDDGMFTRDVDGRPFVSEMGSLTLVGRRVKEADPDIIKWLKDNGKVFRHDTVTHSYPFCWRSDTPLIYRAVSTWFVKVEQFKDTMIAANKRTNWVPDHLRDGRFGNWLENARDWAISRNRFWGTPIPIWRNEEGEMICVGSREDLEKLSGKSINDLHMEVVDKIEIPRANVPKDRIKNASNGKSPFKRVEGVLDCWFESGSMPYAQLGNPETNKAMYDQQFPADFIAEGLDQTRGWFYTLTVIGAALFGKSPFKNVVVNGLILAEDGKKMSKSLRNYPDPGEILELHGADALRLYMIDSPVVKAQELRFSEKGVRDIVRRIMLRWWNSYSFFVNYANIDSFSPKGDAKKSPNILDQWILSKLNTLTEYTNQEMEAYRLYNVVPGLLQFVEELTNTYIRFNRRHFWQDGMPEDKRLAYETLYEVLMTLSKLMAPFAPFMADTIYRNLAKVSKNTKKSVHLESYPEVDKSLKRPALEDAVTRMEVLTMLGRNLREKAKVKSKIPLKELIVYHRDQKVLSELRLLESYFQEELNVRQVKYLQDESLAVRVTMKANFPALGKRLGPKMKAVAAEIQKLELASLEKLEAGETLTLPSGEEITLSDVEIRREPLHENIGSQRLISIGLDTQYEKADEIEGSSREIVRRVQIARKNKDFNLDDRIDLEIKCDGDLKEALKTHERYIKGETLTSSLVFSEKPNGELEEMSEVDGEPLYFTISRVKKT